MTALAGLWDLSSSRHAHLRLRPMLEAQSRFGSRQPICVDLDAWSFGQRLTPLLPEDRFDQGPLIGGNGTFLLAADVRLDSREQLRRDLGIGGAAAEISDSGLLLAAWERWGEASLDRLVGAYAFALADCRQKRLLLVRDPQGQKPLHYRFGSDFAAFASMPCGLHALPEVERRIDVGSLRRFIELAPPEPSHSFFEAVRQAPPGHLVEIDPDGARTRRCWQPSLDPIRLPTPDDYVDAVREQLDTAVRACLRGAGPRLGAHLSAGLDSGGVAATAAQLLRGAGDVHGFTAVPRAELSSATDPANLVDEGPLAGETAKLHPNLHQVEVRSTGTPLDRMADGARLFEQPLPNACNFVWAGSILDAAQTRDLPVLLTGQMGNLGFSHDGADLLPQLFRSGAWLRLIRETRLLRRSGASMRALAGSTVGPLLAGPVWRAISATLRKPVDRSSFSLARADSGAADVDYSYQPRADATQARLDALDQFDFGAYHKGVQAGWGVDLRDPTADRRLIEFCLRIPAEQFLRGGVRRALARRVLADRLPSSVLDEKRRGRQSADWHLALEAARPQVLEQVRLIKANAVASQLIDTDRLDALVTNWPDRWDGSPGQEARYRVALLRSLSAGTFAIEVAGR